MRAYMSMYIYPIAHTPTLHSTVPMLLKTANAIYGGSLAFTYSFLHLKAGNSNVYNFVQLSDAETIE